MDQEGCPAGPTWKGSPVGKRRSIILVAAGSLCVLLGMIGVILPIMPTTPFLLLAAACYMRSSRRLYHWLHTNRLFGRYLSRYRSGEGLPLRFKLWTLATLWLSLALSAFLAVPSSLWWVRLLLLVVGLSVSTHILWIKTCRPDRP